MDRLREFLNAVRRQPALAGNFLGLLNVLIGRHIGRADGEPVSSGLTWRQLAALLKRARWPREAARELGLDPASLPPRDRLRYWYVVITQAGVDSPQATRAGDALAAWLPSLGYQAGPAPGHARS